MLLRLAPKAAAWTGFERTAGVGLTPETARARRQPRSSPELSKQAPYPEGEADSTGCRGWTVLKTDVRTAPARDEVHDLEHDVLGIGTTGTPKLPA